MELVRILGVGLVTAVAAILLRGTKAELSFAVTIAGSVVILLFSIDLLSQTFDIFRQIGEKTGIDSSLIKLMVKVIAIGYLVEFAAGVVEDFGAKSVADKLIFAGKVIIFSVSLPVLQTLLSLIGSFLELV
ncbi:MAG TPA: stage III sporulation AC/AD family protein [Candidatus Borkfalkia faecipullorum]|uniref:Stage III sporulation AC/AD family protein n=1 Tax=Candidatus Borkfalkia faecipullorum TaxID=2838510 RepID=A0A9D2AGG0_9FIRM|nr:stage III sporulation AC/AD family protein [Candidatus Borkfalkia faecipullorum]